jgi:hypothetical protein
METWDALLSRRNVCAFADRPIPGDDLDRVLRAGRRLALSANQQCWDFVVVTDKAPLVDLARVWRGAGHVALSAATIALVAPRRGGPEDARVDPVRPGPGDHGHTHRCDRPRHRRRPRGARRPGPCPATARPAADRFCAWLIALGYPVDRPLSPVRHPNGGHSNRWFAAIGGDRHDHVVATRIRRSPIRAHGGDGRSGSPDAAVVRGPTTLRGRDDGRPSRTFPVLSRTRSPRTPQRPRPRDGWATARLRYRRVGSPARLTRERPSNPSRKTIPTWDGWHGLTVSRVPR